MNSIEPLSEQEVMDFLNKLITESTKVVALLVDGELGLHCIVPGTLALTPTGVIEVEADRTSRDTLTGFTETAVFRISLAALLRAPCMFKDPREFTDSPPDLERELPMSFGLQFAFGDKSFLVFMDVSKEREA